MRALRFCNLNLPSEMREMCIEHKPLPARFVPTAVLEKVNQLEPGQCVTLRMSRVEQANLIRAARKVGMAITTCVVQRTEKPDAKGQRAFSVWKK